MEDGAWRMELGGWSWEDGARRMELGGWSSEDGARRMELGGWSWEDGARRMELGGWSLEDGARRMELGGRLAETWNRWNRRFQPLLDFGSHFWPSNQFWSSNLSKPATATCKMQPVTVEV